MNNWNTAELDNLTTKISSGATPEGGKKSYKDEGISLIRSQNVYDFTFEEDGLAFIDDKQAENLSNVEVRRGDVLLNITGASVGRCCMVPDRVIPARVNQHVMILRADPSKIEPRYLLYYVNSPDIKRGLLQRTHGATRDALTKGQMEAFEVDYPPLPIQRRIADILGALDDKIELNRRMNRTLEEMAQTLYYRLFDGSVGGKGTRLDELVNIKPRMPVPDDDEVLTYVGMADVEPNRMSVTDYGEKEYTSGRRFINGDTLMARITPSLENGKTAFVDFLDEREMAFGSTEFTVMRAEEGTSSCFVYCCARDEDFREYAISTMTGSSGRQRVQEDLLGEYAFEGFSQERMEVFHEKAAPLFNLISSNTSENCTLAETRDYLLPKLISGEVEVGDAIRTGPSTA